MKIFLLFFILKEGTKSYLPLTVGETGIRNFIYFAESPLLQSALSNFPYIADENYKIEPGDSIIIKFFGNFNSTLRIGVPNTGEIVIAGTPVFVGEKGIDTIPFLGKFNLRGKTIEEVKEEIKLKLKEKYPNTDLIVYITQFGVRIVHVVGDVPFPGYYAVSPLTRVTGALLLSGLMGEEMKKGKVYIIRDGVKKEININEYFTEGNLENNPYLKNGDIIIFEKK